MNQDEIDTLYHAIGGEALLATERLSGRVLLYAEVEDGVIAPSLFYQRGEARELFFEFCSSKLSDLIYALWEEWRDLPGRRAWRSMAFVIDAGRFFVDLGYPEQIDIHEAADIRLKRVVQQYFGDTRGAAELEPIRPLHDAANDPSFGLPDA